MTERNISFAQNGEDIVLWRALKTIPNGVYLDVGANHPTIMSVSRKFYDAGWSGVAIEPNPEYAALYREARPRDAVFEAVASDMEAETVDFHLIEGTGLSTLVDDYSREHAEAGWVVRDITVPVITLNRAIEEAGFGGRDLHFLSIDTEGAEAQVLASIDFDRYRPWVLVIEATAPLSTRQVHEAWQQRVEDSGYTFQMFDGLSRFFVANERLEQLGDLVSYSAGILDDFIEIGQVELEEQAKQAQDALATATTHEQQLAADLAAERAELERLRTELAAAQKRSGEAEAHAAELGALVAELQRTLSWRITKPLRGIRSLTK